MPTLQPLSQAELTAAKIRMEAKRLLLLADELEASAERPAVKSEPKFKFGEIKQRGKR